MPITDDPWEGKNPFLTDNQTLSLGDDKSDDPWGGTNPFAEPTPSSSSLLSEAGRGLAAGVQNLKGFGYGIGALAGEVTGIEPLKQASLEGLQQAEKTVQENYAPTVGSYKDIGNFNDALKYLTYGVSSNLPNLLMSLASGGVGAYAGKKLAMGAVKDLTEEAAKNIATKYIKRGAMAGAGLSSIGMETGTISGDQAMETGTVNPVSAIAGGLAAGALDFIPEWYLMKRLGWFGDEVTGAIGSRVAEIAKGAGKQFAMEAPTEALQSVIERQSVPGKSISNREAWDEYIDSFILGGLTGGVAGGVSGVFTKGKQIEESNTTTQNALQSDPVATDIESQIAEVDPEGVLKVNLEKPITPPSENVPGENLAPDKIEPQITEQPENIPVTQEETPTPPPTSEIPPTNISSHPEIVEPGANGEVVGAKADAQGVKNVPVTPEDQKAESIFNSIMEEGSPNTGDDKLDAIILDELGKSDVIDPEMIKGIINDYEMGEYKEKIEPATPDYQAEADKIGITFNGMQDIPNKPSIPTFTDPETKGTFMVKEGETVQGKLDELREKFKNVPGEWGETEKVAEVDQVAKEPWQMTQAEYIPGARARMDKENGWRTEYKKNLTPAAKSEHRVAVEQAIKEGKPVPASVLADYPDLIPTKVAPGIQATKEKIAKVKKEAANDTLPGNKVETPRSQKKNVVGKVGEGVKGKGTAEAKAKIAVKKVAKDKTITPTAIDEKSITTPKAQKKYLLEKIDELIPLASDEKINRFGDKQNTKYASAEAIEKWNAERKADYELDKAKYGLVTIEIPNDGTFNILNTKQSLTEFKKFANKFPASVAPGIKDISLPSTPSSKPKGNRIIQEEVTYYNEFQPRNQGLIEGEEVSVNGVGSGNITTTKEKRNLWNDGWFTNGYYAVKTNKPDNIKLLDREFDVKRTIPSDTEPAKFLGEFYPGEGTIVYAHLTSESNPHIVTNASQVDAILTQYPKATVHVKTNGPIVFKDGKEVVGLVMPIPDTQTLLEDFQDRIKELYPDLPSTATDKTKFGTIHPEDTWNGYGDSLSATIRQQWQSKLEGFDENEYQRIIREDRDKSAPGSASVGGEYGVSGGRGLQYRRLFDEQVRISIKEGDGDHWEGVSVSDNFARTKEFKLAEKHFNSFGYEVVPISRVYWGGAVNHDTKTAFLGEMSGDRYAYFMSHETAHILTKQGNEAALAVKNNINPNHPKVLKARSKRGWDLDHTQDEFAASIIGGMDENLDMLMGDQEENIERAREAATNNSATANVGTYDINNPDIRYGDIIPPKIKQSMISLTDQFQSSPQSTVPDSWVKNSLQPFLKTDNDFRFKDKYLGLPWWNAKRYPAWRRAFEIFGIERPEDRGRLMHTFAQVAEPFFTMEQKMRKAGRSSQAIAESKDRIARVIITGDAQLGPYLKSLRSQYRELKDSPEKTIIAEKIAQIERDNRYSDEQLLAGIKDDRGNTVKLTKQEIDVYKSVRASLDKMFDSYEKHLQAQALRAYKNQKWYTILSQALGMDLNDDLVAMTIGKKLNKAALLKAKSIQPNIRNIFNRAEKLITETPGAEKLKAGELYGKLADKMAKEITDLRDTIKDVSGITNDKELTQMAKDVFSAYLMVRPKAKKIKALRNLYKKQVAFFPRVREQGKYKLKLIEDIYDDEGNLINQKQLYMKMFDTEKGGKDLYTDVMARFGKNGKLPPNTRITTEAAVQTPEFAFQGVNDINMQKVLDDAIEGLKIRETYYNDQGTPVNLQDHLRNLGFEAIAKQFQSRGFGRHMTHRQFNVVKGYEETGLEKILFNYMSGMSGIMTKQIAAADFLEHMKSVKDPKMFEALNKYGRDQLRNETGMDKVSNKVRSFMFTWYLGGVLRPAIIQLTQNFVTGIPKHAQWLRENNLGGAGKADKDYLTAMKDMTTKNLTETEAKMEAQLFTDGVTVDQYIREIYGSVGSRWNQGFEKWMGYLAIPFSRMEIFNRQSAALTRFRPAYKIAMEKVGKRIYGKEFTEEDAYSEAFDSARSFVYDTHYAMGKANLPQIAQGEGIGVGIKTLYTFKSFTHNFALSTYNDLSIGDWKTVLHSMAYLAMFGGLMGLPFFKDLFEFIEKYFGYSPATAVRQSLRGMGGKTLEQFGMNGLPAMLGMNMSGSLAIGVPFLGEDTLSTIGGVYEGQLQKFTRAFDAFSRSDYYRAAANLAPEFARGPITAAYESQVGKEMFGTPGSATTTRGGLVFDKNGKPLSMTGYEAALKSIGFTPENYAREREMDATIKRQKAWVDGRKADIAETYRVERLNKNPNATKNMIKAVRELNSDIKDRDLESLVPRATVGKIIQSSRQIKNMQERRQERYKRAEL